MKQSTKAERIAKRAKEREEARAAERASELRSELSKLRIQEVAAERVLNDEWYDDEMRRRVTLRNEARHILEAAERDVEALLDQRNNAALLLQRIEYKQQEYRREMRIVDKASRARRLVELAKQLQEMQQSMTGSA